MRVIQSLAIIFTSCFFILSSCSREEKVTVENVRKAIVYNDGTASKNGIPIYENWNQFYKHIYLAGNNSKLADFERKNSFVSLLGEYVRSNNDSTYVSSSSLIHSEDGIYKLNIIDYGFAALINKNGFAIVGAGLYKFKGSDVYSLPLENLNIDKGIQILDAQNPLTVSDKVRVSKYKNQSQSLARLSYTPSNSISSTVPLSCGGAVFNGTKYRLVATVGYGAYTQDSYSCPYGLVYDEDARGYVCAGPVEYDGYSTFANFYVLDEIQKQPNGSNTWIHTNYYNVGKVYSHHINATVNFQYNGVTQSQDYSYYGDDDGVYHSLHSYSNPGTDINYNVNSFYADFYGTIRDLAGCEMATAISM